MFKFKNKAMAKVINSSSIARTAVYNLEQAAKRLNLGQDAFVRLSEPKERIEITLNPILPDGCVEVC